jgi:4-hydroxy-3-methylbut-2-en-1-yl diphosphate reductase
MTVSIDSTAGFCWGVVRTIDIAESEISAENTLVSLGDIIHNPKEIERLDERGMKTIDGDELVRLPLGTKVLIRAHGEPPETYRKANQAGIEIVDATCPVVTKLQERLRKFYDENYQIVIFGKKDHAEVLGLRGVCNDECTVILTLEDAENEVDLSRKTVLFSQTTMDKPTFNAIKEYLSRKIEALVVDSMENIASEFHAKDTICGQVSGREQKLSEYAKQNDVMIFVAGKKSSNGKVLFAVCKDANPNSFFVEDIAEIKASWIEGAENIGISGATSTPQWLMEQVKSYIENLNIELSHVA